MEEYNEAIHRFGVSACGRLPVRRGTHLADNGWSLSVQADSPEHTTLTLRVTDWSTQPCR
jgi:hypothetical protein